MITSSCRNKSRIDYTTRLQRQRSALSRIEEGGSAASGGRFRGRFPREGGSRGFEKRHGANSAADALDLSGSIENLGLNRLRQLKTGGIAPYGALPEALPSPQKAVSCREDRLFRSLPRSELGKAAVLKLSGEYGGDLAAYGGRAG